MGIPLYFKQVTEKYEDIIIDHIPQKNSNSLFLDLNCAIHPCCRKIISQYNKNGNIKKLEDKMINETIQYIEKLTKITDPKTLFIAIDGVAPLSKMNQQRVRRHKSIFEKKQIREIKEKHDVFEEGFDWDTNAISPGTKFMSKLCYRIRSELKENMLYKEKNIFFSDITKEGEGEHKILDFIKRNSIEGNIIIYGLDADLIMLSFVSKKNNIFLLRESLEFGKPVENKFLFLDINKLKFFIVKEIRDKILVKDKTILFDSKKLENILNDYIFLCFFIGNDFIPSLLAYNIRNNGITNLLDIYIELYSTYCQNFIVNERINFNFLKQFIGKINENELKLLSEMSEKRKRFRLKKNYDNDIEKELDILNNYPILNQEKEKLIDIGIYDWESRFYKECLSVTHQIDLEKSCENYLEGLHWVFNYYFKGKVTWRWKYNYGNAPLLNDLNIFLKNKNNFSVKFNDDMPLTATEQLLYILPKKSIYLIDDRYKKLMDSESDISDIYVNEFELDTCYKRYLWQCEPILPPINLKYFLKTIKKLS